MKGVPIPSGERFGRLVVIRDESSRSVSCLCDCGRNATMSRSSLNSGDSRSCGCLRSEVAKARAKLRSDATAIANGTRFGRLVIIVSDRSRVRCRCDCGATHVEVSKHDLLNGKTRSCGCLMRETSASNLRSTATRHGGYGSLEYSRWSGMNSRCYTESDASYSRYGGSGVTVHESWRGEGGFTAFMLEIGPAPTSEHTIDRIDGSRGYEPGNVRWATKVEQARNRTSNLLITAFGRTQCLAEWSEETGIGRHTIAWRIRNGWLPDDAVTKPANQHATKECKR